jgi:hypothetical protein
MISFPIILSTTPPSVCGQVRRELAASSFLEFWLSNERRGF